MRKFLLAALLGTSGLWCQHDHAVTGLGSVNFATSCSPSAQVQFSRALALLHSFGYEEARRAFAEAATAGSACAIASWGVAMTFYHPIWAPPSAEELKQGAAACDRANAIPAKTDREKDYIAAIGLFYKDWPTVNHQTRAAAYESAMQKLHERYPSDDEAAIFHALAMLGNLDPTDKTYAKQKAAAEILNGVLPRAPNHPGVAHYLIHSNDYPRLADLALPAARAYAKIAPDSPHALHMPSHIFTRLGLWEDSIQSNAASASSAKALAGRMHPGAGSFDQLHAMDYLVYAYLQLAQDRSAMRVLGEMAAMTKLDEQQFAAAYSLAAAPQRYALERHEWQASAHMQTGPAWFDWNRHPQYEALAHYGKAIGAARAGEVGLARREVDAIAVLQKRIPPSKDYDWSAGVSVQRDVAEALIGFANGARSEALVALRKAADREDALDKHPVTPGALLPAREILGDLLLETGDHANALAAFEATLEIAPHRFNSVAGAARAAELAGDSMKARAYYSALLRQCQHVEVLRPELARAREFQN